jgi:hypothetical protein
MSYSVLNIKMYAAGVKNLGDKAVEILRWKKFLVFPTENIHNS